MNIKSTLDKIFYPNLHRYFKGKNKSSYINEPMYFNQYEKYEEDGIHVWLESPEHIFQVSSLEAAQARDLIESAPISFLVKDKKIVVFEDINDLLLMDDRFCTFYDFTYNDGLEIWRQKINKACICLSKKQNYTGQKLRHEIADLCEDNENIDVYFFEATRITDLFEVYSKYRYVIVAENCCYTSYVSEKIFDVIKCFAYPIYYGGTVTGMNYTRFDSAAGTVREVENAINKGVEFTNIWQNYENLCKRRNALKLRSQVLGLADYFNKKVHKKSFTYHVFAFSLKCLNRLK